MIYEKSRTVAGAGRSIQKFLVCLWTMVEVIDWLGTVINETDPIKLLSLPLTETERL